MALVGDRAVRTSGQLLEDLLGISVLGALAEAKRHPAPLDLPRTVPYKCTSTDPDVVDRWLPAVNERAVGGRTVRMSKPKVALAAIS